MLISVADLVKYWGVKPTSVLHVGAHEAEEFDAYEKFFPGRVIWVEAQPDKAELLIARFADSRFHQVIEAAVWDIKGVDLELKVMTNSQSTSLFELGTHQYQHPDIILHRKVLVRTSLLADILPHEFKPDYVSLDIQGAELRALKGLGDRIETVKWIYSEVNKDELYQGCCLISDLDDFLELRGFRRIVTRWTEFGWGDALYVSNKVKQNRSQLTKFLWILKQLNALFLNLLRRVRSYIKKSLLPSS
jgi:FkbM family methyltransferase